eukprot:m.33150 g.33150  ORF g.33150 m.33150 type:complete len:52 (-) comp7159_c0_seq1:5176-5331(-)
MVMNGVASTRCSDLAGQLDGSLSRADWGLIFQFRGWTAGGSISLFPSVGGC